jgi:hypothetical protein
LNDGSGNSTEYWRGRKRERERREEAERKTRRGGERRSVSNETRSDREIGERRAQWESLGLAMIQ